MENSNLFLNRLAWICFIWPLRLINSFPLHADPQRLTRDEYFWLNKELVIVISVVSVIASITLIFACLCCERGVFKVFENVHNGAQREGYVSAARGTEFTIFPPRGSEHDRGSLNDIKFEPLPDIRPRGAKSNSLRPRPASFCNAISRGLSVEDWFDDPSSNFPRNQLQYIQELGCGWFGQVVEGEAQGISRNAKKTKIVVKILREDATPTDQIYFLHEVKAFRDLNHPHVMRLLAKCLETDPFLIVLEQCAFKDLKTYLTHHRTESESLVHEHLLLRMMCNIASGLNHMHENNFVHTDLAARNCLVGADLLVKIGDYGNSIDKFKDDYYCAADMAVAIRWCAPETLRCTETTIETKEVTRSANIWSLGVVLWEILEFARTPYAHLHEEEVIQRVVVEKTEKLSQPSTSCAHADKIFRVMQLCWLSDPESRPRIEKVEAMLSHLFANCDSKKRTDFETRWNALQPRETATVHNLSREVVEAIAVDANASLFENNFISRPPPPAHRSSSLDFGGNASLSPSLQNLRGSLDELNVIEMTSSLSAETSLSDTNLNNACSPNDASNPFKPRSSSVDFTTHLSAKNVQREFDAWLQDERNKGDEASHLAWQISDAMGTLDAALADEKCTSSEESNQTTPERELTANAETKTTPSLIEPALTSSSPETVAKSTLSESTATSTLNEIAQASTLPAFSSTSSPPDSQPTSLESCSVSNGSVLKSLTRDKSPSMQDFLKLTVIESETSDSDGTQSINSEGAANQLPLTQLCTLPVVVTRDDDDDDAGGDVDVDDVGDKSLAPQFTCRDDDEDVVVSTPTNSGKLNLPDALSLTRVPNTSLENDDEMKIQLDSTLNFRSRINDDASDLDRIEDDIDTAVATTDERTATTDDTNKYRERHCNQLKTIHCSQCRDEIGQLIEDLVQVTHAETRLDDTAKQKSEEMTDSAREITVSKVNESQPISRDDGKKTTEIDETSTDANEITQLLRDTINVKKGDGKTNGEGINLEEITFGINANDIGVDDANVNECESRQIEGSEEADSKSDSNSESKTDFVVVNNTEVVFEHDSTSTMYEIDDIDDALANDSSDESSPVDDENEWTKVTLEEEPVAAATSSVVSQIDNSLSEIGKHFTDLRIELAPSETSDGEETEINEEKGEKSISSNCDRDRDAPNDVRHFVPPASTDEMDEILCVDTETNEIYLLGDRPHQSQLFFAQREPLTDFNSAVSAEEKDESKGDATAEFNLKVEEIFNLPTETTLNFASMSTVDDDDESNLVKPKNQSNEKRVFLWPDSSDDEVDTKKMKSVKLKDRVYEWDSDSETSSSSTSGEFECTKTNTPRRRSWSGEMSAPMGSDEFEENEFTVKVSTWNKDATPKRSSLKISPVKSSSELKKVSFKVSKRPHIYKYPKEKQWEEPNSNLMWNLPQNFNYADWELGDEEMPSDIVDFDDMDDETHATSTPVFRLGDQMLYKLSDISDEYDSFEDNDEIAFVDPLMGAITYRDLLDHYRSNQFLAPPESNGNHPDEDEKSENAEKTRATKLEPDDDWGEMFTCSQSVLDAALSNDRQMARDKNDVLSYTDAIIHDEEMNNVAVESTTGECNGNEITIKSKGEQGANEELLI